MKGRTVMAMVGSLARSGLVSSLCLSFASLAGATNESSALFARKCASCHTFGKGEKIGPDLKGVTDRYARPWLISWIRSSETLIRQEDPIALSLFRRHRSQRMPDHDFTDAQITGLLDYLAAGGPEAEEQGRRRQANTATSEEVQLGKSLFYGEAPLSSGSMACASCHTLSSRRAVGGSLAPDLTRAYTRFWDKALTRRLERPCMLRLPSAKNVKRVTEAESLALRGFLRTVSLAKVRAVAAAPGTVGAALKRP